MNKTNKKKPKLKKKKPSASYHKNLNVTEDFLIRDLSEDLQEAWQKLRSFGESLKPQKIYASHNSIMFSKKVCCFFVRPKKSFLEVWIFLPKKVAGLKSMQSGKKEKYCNLFKLIHADQVEEPLTDWIRESFEFTADLESQVKVSKSGSTH